MQAVVVYESMFGNTRTIAEAIAEGLSPRYEARVVGVGQIRPEDLDGVALTVVGGPTHAWGMSRPRSRADAAQRAGKPGSGLTLEPGATGPGLREWLAGLGGPTPAAAVFDTRIAMPRLLTGAASRKIARRLRGLGGNLVVAPESFLVTKENVLVPGERDRARARAWGATLATTDLAAAHR